MKQILYELKKSIFSKSSVVIIIAFLCFNAALTFYNADKASASEKTQGYESIITSVIKNAEKQIKQLSVKEPDSYAVKYLGEVVRIYSELKELKIQTSNQNVNGWDTYLKFNATNPLLLICIVFISIKLFSTDITTGFLPIIYATTNGRTKYILSKIVEIVVVSIILNILFMAVAFLDMAPVSSFSGLNEYIQSFAAFKTAPYPLFVWQAILLLFGLRTAITISVAAFVGVIIYLSKNRLLALIFAVLLYGANLLLNNLTYLNSDSIFENCNIIAAMDISTILNKYQCVRIFGQPIAVDLVIFVSYLIFFLICSFAIVILYNHFIHLGLKFGSRSKQQTQKIKSHDKTLIGWELSKIFKNRIVVFVMAMLIIVSAVSAVSSYLDKKKNADKIFYDYIHQLKPMSIDERTDYIKSELDRISVAHDEYIAYLTVISQQGKYEGDAEKVENEYYYAQLHEDPLKRASEMCKYIAEHESSKDLTLIYDTGWMKLFETGHSLFLFLIIVLLATFSESTEFSSKFFSILNTTPGGRKNTRNSKLIVCTTLTTVLFIIFTLLQILPILSGYKFEDMTARLISLEIYQNAPQILQLWQYFVVIIIIRYISCLFICILSCQIARLIKISYLSMIAMTVVVQLPDLIYSMGIDMLRYFRFTTFLDGNELLLLGMNNGWLKSGLVFIVFLAASVVISIITNKKAKREVQ